MGPRRTLDMQDRQEFEREIEGDFDEERNELQVDPVSPAYGESSEALIRVRPGAEDEARRVHADLPERVQWILTLFEGEDLHTQYPRREPDGLFVRVCQVSDRSYAGYANIYRGIKALAPHLEDARFFISETYSTWVDEYRIEGGALWFARWDAGEDSAAARRRLFVALQEQAPEDDALRRFVARQWLERGWIDLEAEEETARAEPRRGAPASAVLRATDRALELDPDSAPAWQRKAQLLANRGRRAEAEACFEQALARTPDPGLRQELALLAFTERRDRDAAARLEQTAPEQRSKLAWQVLGLLRRLAGEDAAAVAAFDAGLGRGPLNRDQGALLQTGRVDEVLAPFWDHAERRLREETCALEHVIKDIVDWAEFFQGKAQDGADAPASRQRALALYDRAIALGDPGGAAHYGKGMLFKRTGATAEAEVWLRAAAGLGKAEALAELGSLLLERKQFDEAAALLREALARTTGGYERGARACQLVGALYDKANHLLDDVRDYPAAEAAFDAVIEAQRSCSMQAFEGAWVGKGHARAWLGDHAGALACAERALELNPRSSHAWSAKGCALHNLRRFDEAMPCHEKAIAADPTYWHPYYCKACTLALTGGEPREIVALLRESLRRAPSRRAALGSDPDLVGLRGLPEFDALLEEGAPAEA